MPADNAPPGQRTLTAPEGCGFSDQPVLPVQVYLMCNTCEEKMHCIAEVPPLMIITDNGRPPMPDYMHQCPKCQKKVRMKQPFPIMRYAPHPTFGAATPEQVAKMAAMAELAAMANQTEPAETAETEDLEADAKAVPEKAAES